MLPWSLRLVGVGCLVASFAYALPWPLVLFVGVPLAVDAFAMLAGEITSRS